MPLEIDEPTFGGTLDECLFSRLIGKAKRDVHVGTTVRTGVAGIEAARRIEDVVQQFRLGEVVAVHGRQASHTVAEPLADEPEHIHRENRRGVGTRSVLGVGAIVEHRGQVVPGTLEQILPHDDDRHPGDPRVLLRTGVDQPVLRHIDRPRHEVAGTIADKRGPATIGVMLPLHSLNRLVARDVHVLRVARQLNLAGGRKPVVGRGTAIPRDVHLALAPRLLGAGLPPGASDDVIGSPLATAEEVHRHHGKLETCAALHEEHFVVVPDPQQLP